MRWTYRRRTGWYRWFAILPICLSGECVWCRWVWKRACGLYTEVSFEPQPKYCDDEASDGAPLTRQDGMAEAGPGIAPNPTTPKEPNHG